MKNLVDYSSQQKLEIVKKLHPGFLPILLLGILLNFTNTNLKAEGTKQVGPTSDDFVMLETNNPAFGNFASFGGPAESRLFISVENASEVVYLGLSPEYSEAGTNVYQSQGKASYRMRIFRYNGPGDSTLVHGPFIIGGLSNPFNAFNRNLASAGPDVLDPVNGYSTSNPVYTFQPGSAGDYFIEFEDVNTTDNGPRLLIPFWDITVVQNGEEQSGRIWSKNWAFRTPPVSAGDLLECQWDRSFTGTLYSYTTDGFVSKIDFSESGFQGLSFNVAFNTQGPNNTGDAAFDRQSVPGQNLTGNAAEHQIFLNEPDEVLFPSAIASCGTIVAASLFNCQANGEFCLEVEVNKPGQMNIILDFDQDGDFTPSTKDVNLVYTFTQEELAACVPWDGIRGDSIRATFGDTINIIFIFSQGVQNWAVYDAEFLKNGFCVEVIRPICPDGIQPNFLYWDDREIALPSGTGQPNDGRSGCECTAPGDNCRTWNNFNLNTEACESVVDELTTGYGDKNTLNTWWFANIIKLDTVNVPLLTCQINGDSSICEGDPGEFSVEVSSMTTMFTYSWEGPNGFTGSNASTGPITTPGEYCVTVTDERDCSTVCCRTLTQFDRPTLTVNGTDATCEGAASDGTITAQASGGAGNFMYQLDDGSFQGSGTFTGLTPGIYTVRVMDEAGCVAEAIQEIQLELFGILNYPDSLFICYGDSIQIAPPGDINNLTFEWSPTIGLDDPNSPSPTFFPETTTTYTVTVSLDGVDLCQFMQEVLVFVAPNLNLQVQTSDICVAPFVLTASSDVPNATFTWLDADNNVVGNNSSLEVDLSGTMTFTVIATDSFGCTIEEEVTVSGGPVDIAPLPDQIAACSDEEVNLNIVNLDPNDNLTYSWTPVSAFESGTANSANPNFIETIGAQTVFVSIENQFGCSLLDTVNIVILDAGLQLGFTSEVQCDGLTVLFTNTSENISEFIWDFGDNTGSTEASPSHTYGAAGSYTVTLTTPYDVSCSDTISAVVEVAETLVIAAFDYNLNCSSAEAEISFTDASIVNVGTIVFWNWAFSNGESSSEQNPVVILSESGELTATLTVILDNGCEATISETIDIQLIEANLPDTLILCPNTSVFLNPGGNPAYNYQWSPASGLSATDIANPEATPDVTTTYSVEITAIGSDTCAVIEEVTVIVPEDFTFDIGDDQATCGEDVTLTANASVLVTVEWFSSESGPLGSSEQILVNPVRTDTITAIATDQFGCSKTDTLILIDNGIDISVSPEFDINTCEPIETTISVTNLDGQDQLTYAWSPAENIISGADAADVSVFVNEGSVTFTGIITNQHGCDSTVSVTIAIAPFEVIIPDTVFVCAGESVHLSPDANPSYQYEWVPAEGLDDPSSNNPLFTGTESTSYFLTVSDENSGILCDTIINVNVIVLDSFNLEVSPGDTSLCGLAPLTLNASSTRTDNFDINWYLNNDFSNSIGTGFMLTVTPLEGENIFTAIASDGFGCSDTSHVTIQANDFQPGLETPVQICGNTPTPINPNGNPTYVYIWDPLDGLDLSDPSNPIATIDTDRAYNVTVIDPVSGCETAALIDVLIYPLLNLQTSDDVTICESEVVTLLATTDIGDANISWSLFPDFSVLIGEGNMFSFSPSVGETIVYVRAEDSNGCVESDAITINVVDVPIDPLPDVINVCINTPTPLNPEGDNSFNYTWAPPTGLSATDVANPEVIISENTTYTVTISDASGLCEVIDTVSVEVYPDINLQTSGDTIICELTEGLILTATSDVVATIEWFQDGQNIGSGNSLVFTPLEGTNEVLVVATDNNGCTDSSTVSIIYLPIDSGIPDSILMACFEEPTPLNPNGNPILIYNWAPPTGLSATNVANPIATVNENITYTVTIADPSGICVLVDTLVVEVYPDINLQTTGDTIVCELGGVLTLNATTDVPATIEWFLGEQNIGSGNSLAFTPVEGTNEVLAVATDNNGCIDSSTVTVIYLPLHGGIPDSILMVCFEEPTPLNPNGDPFLIYNWAPPTGLSATDVANPIATVSENTTYTVTIADPSGICVVVDTLVVEVYPDINLQTSDDAIVCEFTEGLTLTATTDVVATIEWFQDGQNIGSGNSLTFTPVEGSNEVLAVATDNNGCSDSSTVTIIYLPLNISIPDSTLMVCFGESVSLNPNGDPSLIYNWAPPTGLSATDVANPIATVSENTTYIVTIADPNDICLVVDTVVVDVYPDINLQTTGDTTICELEELTLTATTDVPATIEWLQDGNTIGSGPSLSFTPMEGTNTITAIATDDNGCSDTSTVTIIYLPFSGGIPDSLLLVCFETPTPLNPTGDPGLIYNWAPPTGLSASDIANPIATVSENITYTVTITDPDGVCEIVDTLVIEVYPDINLQTTGDTTICEIEALTLTATTDVSATIEWFIDSQNIGSGPIISFTPMEGTNTVTAVATDNNGCTDSSTVTIIYLPFDGGIPDSVIMVCFEEPTPLNPDGDAGLLYNWAPPTGLSATDVANPIATVSENITYTVTISDPNGVCIVEDTLAVEVYPDFQVQATGDTTICELTELTLIAAADTPATIEWFKEGDNLGSGDTLLFTPMEGTNNVIAIATDENGCTDSSLVVVIYLPMDGGIPDSLLVVCSGEPTPLNPDGDPGLSYKWSPEVGLDDASSHNPIATLEEDITYIIAISDSANICVIFDTLVVQVAPPLNLETTGDTSICEMSTLTLTASTDVPATVEWSDASGSLGTGNTLEYTPQTAGSNQVTAIATDENGCMDSSTVTIIYLPEDGLIDSPISICGNEPTPLNPGGDPIFIYDWSPVDGLDDPNSPNPIATLSETTTFFVTITTPDQICEVIDTVVVEVFPDIGLETMGDTTVCEISDLLLTATTSTNATIEWMDASGNLGTGDSLIYTPTNEGSNAVLAIATDENGCMDSSTVVILYLPPDGGLGDSTLFVCPNSPTPLNPNADPGLIYNWEPSTGLDDPSAGNPMATISENIIYTVTISTPNMECEVIDTLVVEVFPPMELETSGDTLLCELQQLTLSANTQLNADIEWHNENGDIVGVGNTFIFTPTFEGQSAVIALAIDENGCRDSNKINITYLPLESGVGDSLFVCLGQSASLNPDGDPSLTYQWGPETGLDDPNAVNPMAVITQGITYTVTVTDFTSGCQIVDTLVVEPLPEIGLETSGDTTVCDTTPIVLYATTDVPSIIQWFDPTNNTSLGLGDSLLFSPEPGTNLVGVLAKSSDECSDTSFITIIIEDLDTGLEPEVLLCAGTPTPINPNGNPALVYQWSPETGLDLSDPTNPIATLDAGQTYSVTVSNPESGCEIVAEVDVQIAPAPDIAASGDTTVCAADMVSLSVSSTSIDSPFVWYDDPDLVDAIGNGEMISVMPSVSTTYYVVGTNEAGCSNLDSVEVIINTVQANITPDPMLCEPVNSFELMVTNLDTNQVLSFEWFPDSAIITDPATGPIVSVDPSLADVFTAVVTNQFGCTDTLNTSITIIDLEAQLEIQAEPDTITVGESSDVFVLGCDDCTFDWTGPPDTFEPSEGPSITVNPADPGTYIYEAFVTDNNGCVAFLSQEVVVVAEPLEICDPNNYFLPNTFTPNDDGMNDEFLLRSRLADLIEMELIIYNRWGEEVFRTQDINNGWKGTFKNDRLPPDVYGYHLKVLCPGEETIEMQGNVSLIR